MLRLIIVTPMGEIFNDECDSVHLNVPDDENNRGGGSVGIRQNHADAVMALDKGIIVAYRGESVYARLDCSHGFATVHENVVTAVCSSAVLL